MELNIYNPESNDYCEAVGITPERRQQLSAALDAMVRRNQSGPPTLVKMHMTWGEIASFCDNLGEIFYCTVLHCGWHHRRGRILALGPVNMAIIELGIEQLWDRLRKDLTVESRKIMAKLGTHAEFQKMLYQMLEKSPELCGMLTGAVYHYWHHRAGLDCGKLGDMVQTEETNS